MSLTAREWILLPREEQEKRKHELSAHECFLLRTELDYTHFTEEQKRNMPEKEREAFLSRGKCTEEERKEGLKRDRAIFQQMIEEIKLKRGY